jgi:hypothetical protein
MVLSWEAGLAIYKDASIYNNILTIDHHRLEEGLKILLCPFSFLEIVYFLVLGSLIKVLHNTAGLALSMHSQAKYDHIIIDLARPQ